MTIFTLGFSEVGNLKIKQQILIKLSVTGTGEGGGCNHENLASTCQYELLTSILAKPKPHYEVRHTDPLVVRHAKPERVR